MKCQQFTVLDGVKIYVPVYKLSPWIKLGYPERPSVEETNVCIVSQIGDQVAQVIKECVRGSLDQASARCRIKKALNAIGHWPNPHFPDAHLPETTYSQI